MFCHHLIFVLVLLFFLFWRTNLEVFWIVFFLYARDDGLSSSLLNFDESSGHVCFTSLARLCTSNVKFSFIFTFGGVHL